MGSLPIQIDPEVIWHDLEGELVLLHTGTGRYHGLDPVGSRIWRLLADGADAAGIVESLTGAFEVTPEACRTEVDRLVAELIQARLLVE